jgi:hypothetical protein
MVRMVHLRSRVSYGELVHERFTRLDRRLRDESDAIHVVRHDQPVKVNRGAFVQLVLDDDAHAVAFADADLWPRYDPVVRHRREDDAGGGYPQLSDQQLVQIIGYLYELTDTE